MEKVVIIDALRTPVGKYRGSLTEFSAVELGTFVAKELLNRQPQIVDQIDYVSMGNVLQAGNGQNPARQVALAAGLDVRVPAVTINEVCGSGMKAIAHARQLLQLQEANIVLAGGIESMTNAPSVTYYDKATESYSDPAPVMFVDGLTDVFSGKLMGLTAENVAERYQVSREQQDAFAYRSQQKAAHAQAENWFATEVVPIQLKNGTMLSQDESVRVDTTIEKLRTLKTVFKQEAGTVTAGNASTINDGASAVLMCTKAFAEANQIPYLAEIEDIVEVGIDPAIMGVSPVTAIEAICQRNQLALATVDLFEINEAFAASSIAVEQQLGLDAAKVNIAGGGISLGHAIGASGARLVTTLIHQLRRTGKETGIASLCVGGGIGLALLLRLPKKNKSVTTPFYKLAPDERRQLLVEQGKITEAQRAILAHQDLPETVANHLIENQISDFALPLGIVSELVVDGQTLTVPLVTEEPSVVAACNNGAKMARQATGFVTQMKQRLVRGQIVLSAVPNPQEVIATFEHQKDALMTLANQVYPSIVARGGGVRELTIRSFEQEPTFLSLDILLDSQEAMGANMLNTILEALAKQVKTWTQADVLMSILSNYATEAIVEVEGAIPFSALANEPQVAQRIAYQIEQASRFAQIDPYRAVTHNKGIMNGVEAFVLATGNDTRAMAAAAHAYASRDGQYRGLSTWQVEGAYLVGKLTMPMLVASVGGATTVLPKAQIAHQLLGNPNAQELAKIGAAVGLSQNLAALKALVSEGIQKGHMALQARSLAMRVGAQQAEIEIVAKQLQAGPINEALAKQYLNELRTKK